MPCNQVGKRGDWLTQQASCGKILGCGISYLAQFARCCGLRIGFLVCPSFFLFGHRVNQPISSRLERNGWRQSRVGVDIMAASGCP